MVAELLDFPHARGAKSVYKMFPLPSGQRVRGKRRGRTWTRITSAMPNQIVLRYQEALNARLSFCMVANSTIKGLWIFLLSPL